MSNPQSDRGSTADSAIEVSRSDHDIDGFAARIAELVTATEPVVVQLDQVENDPNRITLTVHQRERL